MSKTLIQIIIAAVVIAAAIVLYQAASEPSVEKAENTEQIQTLKYTNNQYGFSLLYPKEWDVEESPRSQESYLTDKIVISERDYETYQASLSVQIFNNDEGKSVGDWWEAWLAIEDAEKDECIAKYGEGNAPCLYLRDLIRSEEDTTIGGESAHSVELFRFDRKERCTYAEHSKYVIGVCSDSLNPNDPKFEEHKKITDQMRESFVFF